MSQPCWPPLDSPRFILRNWIWKKSETQQARLIIVLTEMICMLPLIARLAICKGSVSRPTDDGKQARKIHTWRAKTITTDVYVNKPLKEVLNATTTNGPRTKLSQQPTVDQLSFLFLVLMVLLLIFYCCCYLRLLLFCSCCFFIVVVFCWFCCCCFVDDVVVISWAAMLMM